MRKDQLLDDIVSEIDVVAALLSHLLYCSRSRSIVLAKYSFVLFNTIAKVGGQNDSKHSWNWQTFSLGRVAINLGNNLATLNEYLEKFKLSNYELGESIVFTCGSGVTASVLALAYSLIDNKYMPIIYDGSWSEYGKN